MTDKKPMAGGARITVAIDGPAGAGKTTVSKECAKRAGLRYIDTGALYRAVALHIFGPSLYPGSDPGPDGIRVLDPGPVAVDALFESKKDAIPAMLPGIELKLDTKIGGQAVMLNGADVTCKIRSPEISMLASLVSAMPEVRSFLLGIQRKMAGEESVIMEGRDIGTVVFPDADLKIFLTANPDVRAGRRYSEIKAKDPCADISRQDVYNALAKRDRQDAAREAAPLRQAPDAVRIDTSRKKFEKVVSEITKLIEKTAASKVSGAARGDAGKE